MKKKLTAIDVGTTKICTITGTLDSTMGLRVLGVGIGPSHGIEKGVVADVAKAKESIFESIRKAEMMTGYKLDSACIGVTGQPISSSNKKATIAITRNDQRVRQEDLNRALDVALSSQAPADQKTLHIIPRSYTLDGQEVENPVGMHGFELSVEAHVITGSSASVENMTKTVRGMGINIDELILEPLADAEAVLSEEEKLSGVMIADIGGGTTNVVIIKDGSIYHTSVLPVAGNQITRDIEIGLGVPFELAEEMKKKYGTLLPSDEKDADKKIGENGHNVSHRDLCDIIAARVEELIHLITLEIPRTNLSKLLPSGIVLAGGCANLPGIIELTQSVTHLPVRIGVPPTLVGVSSAQLNNPAYATSVGLMLWKMKNDRVADERKRQPRPAGIRGFFASR